MYNHYHNAKVILIKEETGRRERERTLKMKKKSEQQMKEGTTGPKEKLYNITINSIISITLTL